jgi:hypothetical protein
MHTLLDLRGPIPSFIHVSDGKMGDAAALDLIMPEAGAIYVTDRGYVDFCRLYALHQAGAFFVTRTKINMNGRSSDSQTEIGKSLCCFTRFTHWSEAGLKRFTPSLETSRCAAAASH